MERGLISDIIIKDLTAFKDSNGKAVSYLELKDDNEEITNQDKRQGGPAAIKPLVMSIIKRNNAHQHQAEIKWQRMNYAEGKNRLLEQIEDSRVTVDADMQRIKNDNANILIRRIRDIISNEPNSVYKAIQLYYLLDAGIGVQYRDYLVLDEKISIGQPNLKSLEKINEEMNIRFLRALEVISGDTTGIEYRYTQKYMNDKRVTQKMKDYWEVFGADKILQVNNVSQIYKSFIRKAKMTKEQRTYLSEYVRDMREERDKLTKNKKAELFTKLGINAEEYRDHYEKALEPIDDLLDNISVWSDDGNTIQDNE